MSRAVLLLLARQFRRLILGRRLDDAGYRLHLNMAFEWIEPFLTQLRKSPNVAKAARKAGIAREYAYRHKEADPTFAAAWEDALAESTDELVGESYRRAKYGVREPIFHMGEECGHRQRYSDTLAIFLLKAHRPAVYGDKSAVTLSGPGGGPVQIYLPDNNREAPDSSEPAEPAKTAEPGS